MDVLLALKSIIELLAIVAASIVAVHGITAWRREFYGKRKIELAEDTLAAFFALRDSIAHIRNPFSTQNEGTSRKKSNDETSEESRFLDQGYIVYERYQKHENTFNTFNKLKYRFMATFGSESSFVFEKVFKILNSIFVSSSMLSTHYWKRQGRVEMSEVEFKKHLESMHKHERIFWDHGDESDEIRLKLKEVETELVRLITPSLKDNDKYLSKKINELLEIFFKKRSKMSDNSNDKSESSVESSIKVISFYGVAILLTIYCFSLGYFNELGIPDIPSPQSSFVFFFKTVFKTILSTRLESHIKYILMFLLLVWALFSFLDCLRKLLKAKQLINILLIVCVIYIFHKTLYIIAPVILVTLIVGLLSAKHHFKADKDAKNYLLEFMSAIAIFCLCFAWSYDNFRISNYENLEFRKNFSQGYTKFIDNDRSYLIWVESEKNIWAYCNKDRKIIYGTNLQNEKFIETEMSSSIFAYFCPNS